MRTIVYKNTNKCNSQVTHRKQHTTIKTKPFCFSFSSFALRTPNILTMEAMKMKLFVAVLVAMIAFSAVQQSAAAVDAPAPSPTSDASSFIPTVFASVSVLVVGLLF